jgi:hypothetical protein
VTADYIGMPVSNQEPEKYSIDEMMERLKHRGEGEGQLVTRADGTQAIKVRKRKRRTEQVRDKLKAQNQRIQLLQISGFIIFLIALLILGALTILYSNSSAFRKGLITKIESATGCEAKIQGFRINPATASVANIGMNWPESSPLNRLEVNSLEAKISPISFVGKVFQGQEITGNNGKLFLVAPSGSDVSAIKKNNAKNSLIKFNRYSVTSLNLFFSKEEVWDNMLEGVEASYLPTKLSKGGEIRLNKGELKIKGWPLLSLDRSYIQVRGEELDIKSMRFKVPATAGQELQNKGSINLSGVISPQVEVATHKLHVDLESFQISPLLGSSMGKFFQGRVITNTDEDSNMLRFTPGSGIDAELKINMSNAIDSRISLSHFKFLSHLSIVLDDRWYEFPNFDDEVKFLMHRTGEIVELKNIHLEQRARMIIKGTMVTKDVLGNISGTLKVGVPDYIITASKDRRLDILFSPVKDGYRWIDVELSGSGSAPTDSFKNQYQAISLTSALDPNVNPKPKTEGVDSFESLTKPE